MVQHILIPFGYGHVDLMFKLPIQESIVNVYNLSIPLLIIIQVNTTLKVTSFTPGEIVSEVQTWDLAEFFSNQSGMVDSISFDFEYPTASYQPPSTWNAC